MDAIGNRIDAIRREWGSRLLVLVHHYQRDAVIAHADAVGDSLELARKAASSRAERIVFCGVRFMAETADILSGPDQAVFMPETSAGCPMADMADAGSALRAWDAVTRHGEWVPVVYVNSSAEVKAFCGLRGGSACTSSNAAKVFAWALDRGRRVLFFPDEHLGVNTAADLGIPGEEVAIYDPGREGGGLTAAALARARVIVWKGFCIVHQAFTVEQVRRVREVLPQARIIVHPETPKEVVRLCDAHGSTSQIIRYVEEAPAGATIVVGTELNLVQRLADTHRGRVTVKVVAPSVCANMAKTNARNLLEVLEHWPEDRRIRVPEAVARPARLALERMLSL